MRTGVYLEIFWVDIRYVEEFCNLHTVYMMRRCSGDHSLYGNIIIYDVGEQFICTLKMFLNIKIRHWCVIRHMPDDPHIYDSSNGRTITVLSYTESLLNNDRMKNFPNKGRIQPRGANDTYKLSPREWH